MAVIEGLSWTFNTVAEEYDRLAPKYPAALYADLFDYKPVGKESRALEIGIATGQATAPVLATGCELIAVELGDKLAAIARENYKEYPRFTVVNARFEEYPEEREAFDLVYSAGAFHWIEQDYGYRKVFSMLKPGGAFARFAKHPYYCREQEAMNDDIQKVYAKYMSYSSMSPEYTEAQAKARAELALQYGFRDAAYRLYTVERTYGAEEYCKLIATYSDHIILPEASKPGFYTGIRSAIEKHGGSITLRDTIDLNMARK